MAETPNITVADISLVSLAGRIVYLTIQFINHDDQDYYHLLESDPYVRGFSVNNTFITNEYDMSWQICPCQRDTIRGVGDGDQFNHIPANAQAESILNVVSICPFLEHEPVEHNVGGFWFRYENEGRIEIMNSPCYRAECFAGSVNLPKTEFHFELIE